MSSEHSSSASIEDMDIDHAIEMDEVALKEFQIERCRLLMEAAKKGDQVSLVHLLYAGVSVEAEQYTRWLFYASQYYATPLQLAAENGHFSCVKELIRHEADVNRRDRFDMTAVHVAAENGHINILRALLDAGAECNVPTKLYKRHPYIKAPHLGGTTPLHLAANRNQEECIKELIQRGADYNAIDQKGRTSLYISAENGSSTCVMAHLKNAIGKDILSLPGFDTGDTPLHFAVQHAMVDCVAALLDAGSDPNHRNHAGTTPLHCAVCPMLHTEASVAEEILHLLVLRGHNTDVNMTDRSGLTPLHYVTYGSGIRNARRPRMAHFLIAYGANVNIRTIRGNTLLEAEIKSQYEDYTLLRACIETFMNPPVLSINILEEPPPFVPPHHPLDPPNFNLARNIHSIFAFDDVMEEINENFYLPENFFVPNREKMKKKVEWYRAEYPKPMTLQHYCRYSIRMSLGPKRLRNIKDLPLPTKVKEYLLLHVPNALQSNTKGMEH